MSPFCASLLSELENDTYTLFAAFQSHLKRWDSAVHTDRCIARMHYWHVRLHFYANELYEDDISSKQLKSALKKRSFVRVFMVRHRGLDIRQIFSL